MKKVLCVFLAVVFICSVFAYGTNKRFSVAVWIDNLLSIGRGVNFEMIADVWRKDRVLKKEALDIEIWEDVYTCPLVPAGDIEDVVSYVGNYPIFQPNNAVGTALYEGSLEFERIVRCDSAGKFMVNPDYRAMSGAGGSDGFTVESYYWYIPANMYETYESYDGDNPVLEFFDNVKAFFLRVSRTAQYVGLMFVQIFDNVGKLLPWNATVEVT